MGVEHGPPKMSTDDVNAIKAKIGNKAVNS
jgi:hypothetical protein